MRASSLFDCDFDLSILSHRSPLGLQCALPIAMLRFLFQTVNLHFVLFLLWSCVPCCAVCFGLNDLIRWHDIVPSCIAFLFFSCQVFILRVWYFISICLHRYLIRMWLDVLFSIFSSYSYILHYAACSFFRCHIWSASTSCMSCCLLRIVYLGCILP